MALTVELIRKKTFSGFTLIELIMVAGLMIIVGSLGVAGYNNFNEKQKVEQAARELASNLRKVQNYALIGRKDYLGTTYCPVPAATLKSWIADLENNYYYGQCFDGSSFPSAGERPKLFSGVVEAIGAPGSLIEFNVVNGETSRDFTVTVGGGANVKTITVTQKGAIQLN